MAWEGAGWVDASFTDTGPRTLNLQMFFTGPWTLNLQINTQPTNVPTNKHSTYKFMCEYKTEHFELKYLL